MGELRGWEPGSFVDVGCDDLGFVAGEDDVGRDANTRVSVEDVRFEIITFI